MGINIELELIIDMHEAEPSAAGDERWWWSNRIFVKKITPEPSSWKVPAKHKEKPHAGERRACYDELHNGYLALFGCFMHIVTGDELPGYGCDTTLRRGSRAVAKFGAYQLPQTYEEFVPWAGLGYTTVLIHGHCVLGGFNNAPVRRFMLTHLKQLGSAGDSLIRHPLLPLMIALGISDSVIKR